MYLILELFYGKCSFILINIILIDCSFSAGDVLGGKETPVGNSLLESEIQCAKEVRTTHPDATGATYRADTKQCWAEFGDHIGASDVFRACLFKSE